MGKIVLPGDNGKDTRTQQIKQLVEHYQEQDISARFLGEYADIEKLTTDQRVWLSFLYSTCYNELTAIYMLYYFPEPNKAWVDSHKLDLFWKEHKSKIIFGSDRRYLYNMNTWAAAVMSFLQDTAHSPSELAFYCQSPEMGSSLYSRIKKKWQYTGAMGAFLFFDAMRECITPRIDVETIPWADAGKTVYEGLCHSMYLDDMVGDWAFAKTHLKEFDNAVEILQNMTGAEKTIIESALCMYRKLFKGSRYFGFYADRQLESCLFYKKFATRTHMWEIRKRLLHENCRGEDNDWNGVRKHRNTLFLQTGVIFKDGV